MNLTLQTACGLRSAPGCSPEGREPGKGWARAAHEYQRQGELTAILPLPWMPIQAQKGPGALAPGCKGVWPGLHVSRRQQPQVQLQLPKSTLCNWASLCSWGSGSGRNPAIRPALGTAVATQVNAVNLSFSAPLPAWEGTPTLLCRPRDVCSRCLVSSCSWHQLQSWNRTRAKSGLCHSPLDVRMLLTVLTRQRPATSAPSGLGANYHVVNPRGWLRESRCWPAGIPWLKQLRPHGRWQESDGLLRRKGRSPVRTHLQAREGLKAGGWAASPASWSGDLQFLFSACPWPPMDPSTATFSPVEPIKGPAQPEQRKEG